MNPSNYEHSLAAKAGISPERAVELRNRCLGDETVENIRDSNQLSSIEMGLLQLAILHGVDLDEVWGAIPNAADALRELGL